MLTKNISLMLGLFLVVFQVYATEPCELMMQSQQKGRATFKVIPSDRVPSESKRYAEYVQELVEPGGVLDKLGIGMTGQIVEFLQGRDLNAVTSGSSGGYPVSHYLDGASVLKSLQPANSFALEVVYPGGDYQHGFYRDDNPYEQQVSIIDHVVGHNNFAMKSGFPHYRAAQGMLASRRLDTLLQDLYVSYDKDEVQRFYLWALTLAQLMDYYTPYFQDTLEFEPKLEVRDFDPLGRNKTAVLRHPKAPTENILQAFAANLAPHEPEWKSKILSEIAAAMAFRPALVHTQIMNEGWASIMQEILPYHTKNNHNFAYWLNASRVMQTEQMPDLRDPYSLGVAIWRRIRENFEERQEIKAFKTRIEKDREFIQYANEEIIARMDDQEFLRFGIDRYFIDKYKLAVVRRATDDEYDPNLEPEPYDPTQPPPAQWIVVSRDREKVIQSIIDQVIKPKYQWRPRVKLVDFTRPQTGEVQLVINDEFGSQLAIEKESVGAALFALAQIIKKPISLETNLFRKEMVPVEEDEYFVPPWLRKRQQTLLKLFPVRIVVSETADVRVYVKDGDNEHLNTELSQELASYLKNYIDDLYLDDDEELDKILNSSQSLKELQAQITAKAIDDSPYDSLIIHTPNVAGAILEYKSMLDRRMLKALERAMKSRSGIVMGGQNVKIKALPSVERLSFDKEYAQHAIDNAPKAPVSPFAYAFNITAKEDSKVDSIKSPFDDGGRVGPIDGNPGDHFWGPGNPPPGEGRGKKPGEDPNDLSWVEVPADLYSKYLGERVKLPILNKKPGQSRTTKIKTGKRINRMTGQAVEQTIAENALKRGFEQALQEGIDPTEDIGNTLDLGFSALRPRDWVVRSTTIAKKPDTKAVVTFILDASGSTANYMEAFKRFVFDIQTLIKANYKGFDFRYVIFDTKAHVVKNETEFFKAELGGGTMYSVGIKKVRELFEAEYPRSAWDRYTFLMGDMEDYDPDQAMNDVRALLEDSEFFGTVAGLHFSGDDESGLEYLKLLTGIKTEVTGGNPQMGLTVLRPDGTYGIENIRQVLRNDDENE